MAFGSKIIYLCLSHAFVLQVDKDIVIQYRPPGCVKKLSQSSCCILEKCLEAKEPYTPVFLGEQEFYRKMNSVQRNRFLEQLCLSFPIDMLRYSPGGNIGNVVFVWRVPEDRTESQMMTDAVRMTVSLKPKLPEYHSRQQRINFATTYSNLTKISPAIRRAMYADLTGDSAFSVNPEMDARVHLVLLGESPELVYDLRRLNTGRVKPFEVFFMKLGEIVEERVAADERRHGVAHMSRYLSLPDLCEQVKSQCPPDTPIPSIDLVRLQFCPKNPASHAALNFTGRFPIQYKIQVRQLRQQHVDEYYAAAIFKYL